MTRGEPRAWLPPGRIAAVCLSVDDVHPTAAIDGRAAGDVAREALGVGDERFQRKCAARIDALLAGQTTFVLVSHDMHSVTRLCSRAIWLDAGVVRADGPAAEVTRLYVEGR